MGNGPLSCEECVQQFLTSYIDISDDNTLDDDEKLSAINNAVVDLSLCVFGIASVGIQQEPVNGCELCVDTFLNSYFAIDDNLSEEAKLADIGTLVNILDGCVFPIVAPPE
ncbi:hypothetical protein [Alkalihalobacterium elongatum]|uniref:hypothetical protein n=1 Tax=Alkalihalobacterium elongatum TaxID=2675466 RepID=UPI001C1FA895|nr:hypothetical protein [Alkalihalobacterium elongatum]